MKKYNKNYTTKITHQNVKLVPLIRVTIKCSNLLAFQSEVQTIGLSNWLMLNLHINKKVHLSHVIIWQDIRGVFLASESATE